MNQKLIAGFVIILLVYLGFTIYNQDRLSEDIDNPEYQAYIEQYRKKVTQKVSETIRDNEEKSNYDLEYKSTGSGGTTGNFEGPQVHLKGIKFHDEFLTKQNLGTRLKHMDGVSAHFDPDHSYYGLPDVKISLKDVRLYEMEKGPLSEFLGLQSDKTPKPYKIYKKRIVNDSLGLNNTFLVMQLWLTEFDVTIDIRPDRDIPIDISNDEKEKTRYPGYWYGSAEQSLKLKDIGREHKDFRYGDLSFILEVIPDNSPIYVKTNNGISSKADFAIGAIYCKSAQIGNEPDVQRISTNIHAGMPVFLNNDFEFDKMNTNANKFSTNLETNAEHILDIKTTDNNFIWNKPYYMKLFFNNIGTWRSGLFNQNQFHDQVSYSFLMPVFVVGSWDVIVPQEILPQWAPPKPFIRQISLRNFLPFWNMGIFGRIASGLVIIILITLGIFLVFPTLIPIALKKVFT